MLILVICQQYISLFLVHTETLTDSLGSCWSSRRQPWPLPCSWRLILILLMFPSPSVKPIRDQFEKGKSIRAWDFPIDSQHPHLICPLHSLPICSLAYLTLHCVAPSSVFMSLYLSPPPVLSCVALKKHWPSYLDFTITVSVQLSCKCSTQMTFRSAVSMNCTKWISRQYLCPSPPDERLDCCFLSGDWCFITENMALVSQKPFFLLARISTNHCYCILSLIWICFVR